MTSKLVTDNLEIHLGRAEAPQAKFHFSKERRRDDLERARKLRKREWLLKMYRSGMEEAQRIEESLQADDGDPSEAPSAGHDGHGAASTSAAAGEGGLLDEVRVRLRTARAADSAKEGGLPSPVCVAVVCMCV